MSICPECGHDTEQHILRDPEGIPDPEPCRVRVIHRDAPNGYRRCGCPHVRVVGFIPVGEPLDSPQHWHVVAGVTFE